MEPTNQQNTNQVGVQNQPQQLDPQAVMLAQSIRDVESGGDFSAKGASGEYGAYQWEPNTWKSMSQEAGVNVPLDQSTPEQQNQVAYTQIKKWKDQGKNVGQIASMWNGGANNPDAYTEGDSGTNSKGVSYNVPQYAQKVAQTYQDLKSNHQDETINPTPDPTNNPKYQAISTDQNSMPTWEKWLLGGAGGAAALGLGLATGGVGDLLGLGGEAALAGGEGLADAGAATEAGAAASDASQSPGILSKILGGTKTIIKDAVIGSGVNKGIGAIENLVGGQNQAPTDQPTPTIDNATLPQSLEATRQIHNGLNEALQQTPTGRVFSNTPEAKSGLEGLSSYGITPEVINGNYDSTQAKANTQTLIGNLSDNIGQVLDAEGESANLNEAISEATSNMKKYTPSNEWAEAENHIKQQAETYKQFADPQGNIPLGTMERMKKEQYLASGKWDTTTTSAKKAAHKALGVGSRNTIKKHTKNKELYERAMLEEKKLINGHKILKKLDGKKAKESKGELKKMISRLAHYSSIAVGDKIGGPLGAIVGEIVGNSIVKYGTKNLGENILDTPSMKKALELVGKNKPQVLGIIKKEIKKYEDLAQKEKQMTEKRTAYQAKKSAILNPKSKSSEYEPYQNPFTIAMGKRSKKKDTLPVIQA